MFLLPNLYGATPGVAFEDTFLLDWHHIVVIWIDVVCSIDKLEISRAYGAVTEALVLDH